MLSLPLSHSSHHLPLPRSPRSWSKVWIKVFCRTWGPFQLPAGLPSGGFCYAGLPGQRHLVWCRRGLQRWAAVYWGSHNHLEFINPPVLLKQTLFGCCKLKPLRLFRCGQISTSTRENWASAVDRERLKQHKKRVILQSLRCFDTLNEAVVKLALNVSGHRKKHLYCIPQWGAFPLPINSFSPATVR